MAVSPDFCGRSGSNCGGCDAKWCKSAKSTFSLDTTGLMMGISYGPSPMMDKGALLNDDFFCDEMKWQWGMRGRGDLQIIKALGANSVRLYGNDPGRNHEDFLDLALRLELGVIPGVSDYP
eukprot:4973541-Heterocapsa_arctica.AAC.1